MIRPFLNLNTMLSLKKYIGLLGISLALWQCGPADEIPAVDIHIERLEQTLMNLSDTAQVHAFLVKHEDVTRAFFRAYPDDPAFISYLMQLTQHPDTRKLHDQTQAYFGDLTDIETQLEQAFGRIKSYYPNFRPPRVVTLFSGLQNDVYVSDSLMVIALEAFVGPKALFRPQQPDYILRRYEKESLVPTLIRLLADSYAKSNTGDRTLLNDMIYFGKTFEFTQTMLPEVPPHRIIDYADTTYQQTWYAQDLVWAHFVDHQLFFELNPRTKEKYIGERPAVPEIGPACPGRIGQWVGWRIVNAYRTENPKVTFVDIMENKEANQILQKSAYRGQVGE